LISVKVLVATAHTSAAVWLDLDEIAASILEALVPVLASNDASTPIRSERGVPVKPVRVLVA
jgi:hypothetical protein